MGFDRLITSYYGELMNLVILLEKYVSAYRLLVGGAGELNGIALAKKSDVKDALKRADKLGDIIEDLLDVIENCECTYLNYVKIKSEILILRTKKDLILAEIDDEFLFQNSKKRPDDHHSHSDDNDHDDNHHDNHHDDKSDKAGKPGKPGKVGKSGKAEEAEEHMQEEVDEKEPEHKDEHEHEL